MTTSDMVMLNMLCFGLAGEVISDAQKWWWIRNGREGGFCDTGLWKYSRHPNYASEILMSCAMFGLTYRTWAKCGPLWVASVVSPLITSYLLVNVSGVPMAESKMDEKMGPDNARYNAYKKETAVLFPGIYWWWRKVTCYWYDLLYVCYFLLFRCISLSIALLLLSHFTFFYLSFRWSTYNCIYWVLTSRCLLTVHTLSNI